MEDVNVSWGHYIHQLEIVRSFQYTQNMYQK